jgi:hypothetical protein
MNPSRFPVHSQYNRYLRLQTNPIVPNLAAEFPEIVLKVKTKNLWSAAVGVGEHVPALDS